MALLLFHPITTSGMIATSENRVGGELYPARHYYHSGHFVELDGPALVVDYDARELEAHGYRLATAAEQNQFAAQKRKAARLEETAKPAEVVTPSPAPQEEATTRAASKPAAEKDN